MRRLLPLILLAVVIGVWAPALSPAEGQRVGFLFNLGFMTKEGGTPNWLTLGAELAIPLGPNFSINPEVTAWGSNFAFHNYYIVPGILLDFRAGRVVIGAGLTQRFWFSSFGESGLSESLSPKFQVGYRSRNSRIALIIMPIPSQGFVSFGLALGIGF
jgi:hypothetical protein